MEEEYKKFGEMGKTAFILGYTGQTGKVLVQELVNRNIFKKILLFGRREVPFPDEDKYKCLDQRTIDYDNLEAHKSDFEGCEVGYCCLGTTKAKSGKDGFYKVDHDYCFNSAKVAKDTGCKQFHLVSSKGAKANSSFYYLKVKGQVEEHIKALDFDQFIIYHPAVLLCEREERRMGEKCMIVLMKPITCCAPTAMTIPITTLVKGMINTTVEESQNKVDVLENKDIFRIAGDL